MSKRKYQLPEASDIAEQIKLGIFTTFPLLFLFFMVWGFRIVYKLVYSATNPAEGGGGDD